MIVTQLARPTEATIRRELTERGLSDAKAQELIRMFQDVARCVHPDQTHTIYMRVGLQIHDAFDAIMPDHAYAETGSLHERINQTFLPEGWTFWHDRHGNCTIEAVRWP